jgi:hypothetical protein
LLRAADFSVAACFRVCYRATSMLSTFWCCQLATLQCVCIVVRPGFKILRLKFTPTHLTQVSGNSISNKYSKILSNTIWQTIWFLQLAIQILQIKVFVLGCVFENTQIHQKKYFRCQMVCSKKKVPFASLRYFK